MINIHDSNKLILAVCALTLLTVLAGCSGELTGTPTESMAKEFIESQKAKGLNADRLKIESFVKTSEAQGVEAGVELYVIGYQAEFFYPSGVMPECVDIRHHIRSCSDALLGSEFGSSPFKKVGERETVFGKVLFQKTESGWIAKRQFEPWEL